MTKKPGLMGRVQFGTDETMKNAVPENLSLRGPKTPQAKELQAHQQVRILEAELLIAKNGIPLELIDTEDGRKRSLKNDSYEDLKNNIFKNGLIHKIVVRQKEGGRYEVIAGHNRLQIFKELLEAHPEEERFKNIPSDVQYIAEDAVEEKAFYSNLFNSPLSDFEKYLGFKEIQITTKETQEQMAKRAGVSQSQITRIFAFDRFTPSAKELLKKHPHILGANSAQRMTSAIETKVLPALEKLIAGDCNESQAVSLALAGDVQKPAKPKPIVIRSGNKTYAEIKVNKGLLAITLKDEANVPGLLKAIEELLESAAKSN